MPTEVIGDLDPTAFVQQDTLACMPAGLLTPLESILPIDETEMIDRLTRAGLYEPGVGTNIFPAHQLDLALEGTDAYAREVYPVGYHGESYATEKVDDRLRAIHHAVSEGEQVLLAFTKEREDDIDILHYVVVTAVAYETDADGDTSVSEITIVDPSDRRAEEGKPAVFTVSQDEFEPYITPTQSFPVMAWGIGVGRDNHEVARRDYGEESDLPGMKLLEEPVYKRNQTGEPIPNGTLFPTSVGMTTHESHTSFNNHGDVILSVDGKLPEGYPRFVVSPHIHELSHEVMGGMGHLPFATKEAADTGARLAQIAYDEPQEPVEAGGLYWIKSNPKTLDAWQHTGLGISARHADALRQNPNAQNDVEARDRAVDGIKDAIIAYYDSEPADGETYTAPDKDDIYLFSNGMAAIYMLNQAIIEAFGDDPAAVFDFPYVDTFKQRLFGPNKSPKQNIVDMRDGDAEGLHEHLEDGNRLRALWTEIIGNPVLGQADLNHLHEIADGEFPVVIDDTISTMFNVDDAKLPNSVVARATSLTKFFSSVGDVMGGSIVLRPDSPFYEQLKPVIDEMYEEMYADMLWHEDAEAMLKNSKYFPEIMPVINENSANIAQWLDEEYVGEDSPLAAVYHPSLNPDTFEQYMSENGGHSGLMSLEFHSEEEANRFFDELEITKGPSLGTYYSIACQYTWLAHKPLSDAEKFGVKRHLVRISFGIEDKEDLMQRIASAMERRHPDEEYEEAA